MFLYIANILKPVYSNRYHYLQGVLQIKAYLCISAKIKIVSILFTLDSKYTKLFASAYLYLEDSKYLHDQSCNDAYWSKNCTSSTIDDAFIPYIR